MATRKPTPESLPKEPLARLLSVMAWLRDREHGCPWDIDQTFRTIAPYTIEEAYEVADAIDRDDMPALKEELGDLLLQVVYHAQMASESGAFDFAAVAQGIAQEGHAAQHHERERRIPRIFKSLLPMNQRRTKPCFGEYFNHTERHRANGHQAEDFRRQQPRKNDGTCKREHRHARTGKPYPNSRTNGLALQGSVRAVEELSKAL